MDTKKYEILLYVVEKGSILKAAEELGYTQSGISNMINRLEEELGLKLLERTTRGVKLTGNGERLRPLIQELLQQESRISDEVKTILGNTHSTIRIATYHSMATLFLNQLACEFEDAYTGMRMELFQENNISRMESWLQDGYVDLAVLSKRESQTFESITLINDPMYVVLPPNHPLKRMKAIPIAELKDLPFVMFKSVYGYDPDIVKPFNNAHIFPNVKYTSAHDDATLLLVSQGKGVTVLSKTCVDACKHDVIIRPLIPACQRTIVVGRSPSTKLTPATASCIESIRQACQKVITECGIEDVNK